MNPIIEVQDLSKLYRLGPAKPITLRASLQRWIGRHRNGSTEPESHHLSVERQGPSAETFWALKDVAFNVMPGEVVGIIGRNGAGKSTLLKILSRITEPTAGRAVLRGRVASLLEVGTGFHAELSGRENVFLNGAILGMKRAEIARKFDEIVAFADVEAFIDTPVKHYSSGMYLRLAFAVAAHLEPEILIVDEVLAVGDAAFQKKCLGKIREVSRDQGRTVLFVSHNMNAVESLCGEAVLLRDGRLHRQSRDVRGVIREYLSEQEQSSGESRWMNPGGKFANPYFQPLSFAVGDAAGQSLTEPLRNDGDAWIRIEAEVATLDPALTVGYAIYTEDGALLYWSYQTDTSEARWPQLRRGRCILRSALPKRLLNEGTYRIELIGGLHFRSWLFEPGVDAPAIMLRVQGGLSDSPYWIQKRPGLFAPEFAWELVE